MIHDALRSLLDEQQATQQLTDAGLDLAIATPDYVRYKPKQPTMIGYRFLSRDGSETRGYAVWCPDPPRASAIYDKALSLRPRRSVFGPGVIRLNDNAVVYGFPNDARLRRLRWYSQPRKIKRSLHGLPGLLDDISSHRTNVEVLRYKPERRVVVRIDLVSRTRLKIPVVLRYTTGRDAPLLAKTAEALRRNGVATPAPLAQIENGRVGIDEFAAGEQLRSIIDRGLASPAATADAIQHFHRTTPPSGTAKRLIDDDLFQARKALSGLAELHPSLAGPLAALAQRLSRTAPHNPGPLRLIHGDLHPKNILGDPTGHDDTITFVDLERAAVGQPASDLGRLLGHAKALEIRDPGSYATATEFAQTVIDRYRVGVPIPDAELSWYTAIALIDQATLVARHLEGDWRWSSAYLAAAAFRELATTSTRKELV
ncbi:MAG: phosphotransferase family protein [Acidimicrobiales bacterium]